MQGETGQAYKSNYLKYHNGTVTEHCSPLCERLLQQVWFGKQQSAELTSAQAGGVWYTPPGQS
jgi:hypothetical protein